MDETPTTSNSAESTARLIYPLLAHVQLLEIRGVSWVFFLWSEVKNHLNGKYAVRLDKIAHSSITWNSESLRAMVEARVQFFSGNRLHLKDLFDSSIDVDDTFRILLDITMNSPRELIKLLDTILREHDARGDQAPDLIDIDTLAISQDKFSVDTVGDWFASGPLQQVLRLGRISFVNRDVQAAFKIGDQGARNRIKNWEDAGLVKQSGTVPNEIGAKQAYRFVVTDTRVKRVIERKLLDVVGAEGDQPEEGDSTESKSLL